MQQRELGFEEHGNAFKGIQDNNPDTVPSFEEIIDMIIAEEQRIIGSERQTVFQDM